MLAVSTFLEVNTKEEQIWVTEESESSKGEKAMKSVLMSCSFWMQLGHGSTGDCVEYASGLSRRSFGFSLLP